MRSTTVAVVAAALAAATLRAQEPRPRPSPKPAAAEKAAPAAESKPEKAEKGPPPPLVSVRVDVKVIDERAGQPPLTKQVSLTVADRRNGFSRSSVEAPGKGNDPMPPGFRIIPLNVDAAPFVDGNRIRLDVGVEYQAFDAEGKYPKLEIKQRLALVLDDGKAVRVSQSPDPLSDRRVSLEVTATIIR